MVKGQEAGADGVEWIDADGGEAFLLENRVKVCDEGVRGVVVLVGLDGDFPRDDGRNQQLVVQIRHQVERLLTQQSRRIERPQYCMSIEKELHDASSSGFPSSIMMSKPYSRSSSSVSRGFHQSFEYWN